MEELKIPYLPVLKRSSNSTLNLRIFEKAHSKQPKIVRCSKLDGYLPKIGTIRDNSTHHHLFDVRKVANLRQERVSHLLGKENMSPHKREGHQRDYLQRNSRQLLSINFKHHRPENGTVL